mmetsp:Transcript_32389/g.73205  ORF Transcript_32389/g.73205 Transcript_32389/m.73205 type:complete len:89 (-) Transcript_32389:225-491(-)
MCQSTRVVHPVGKVGSCPAVCARNAEHLLLMHLQLCAFSSSSGIWQCECNSDAEARPGRHWRCGEPSSLGSLLLNGLGISACNAYISK